MKKSIFKASFEESKNLFKDGLANLQKKQHDKASKNLVDGKATIKFRLISILLTLFLPIGFGALLVGASIALHSGDDEILVNPSAFRLLTWEVYLGLLGIWFILILLGKRLKQNFILPYRYHFHVVVYLIILLIEVSLIGIEIASTNINWFTNTVLVLVILLLSGFMIYTTPASIRKILYGKSNQDSLRNKIAKAIAAYGMGFLGLAVIIKYILGFFSIGVSDSLENMGIVAAFVLSILVGLWVILYIELPYLLQGYYKLKYSEQYRFHERKTIEEWYGQKYLKKHKELLQK
ncbi:hypothetical protein ACVR1G_07440 [Streptococcus dentasini]